MDVVNDEHPTEVLGVLNTLRERSELTDVVLEVEGRSFPSHRAVLASCSPYFRTMFTSSYAEAGQGRIRIHDVGEVAMATILDYAYTGCLKTEPDQVQAVMSAARLLQVDFVCDKAAEYMKDHLDLFNCADVWMYADLLGNLALQEASGRYMASRFNQVALQPSFLQLSLPQLQSLLNRDDLMTSEDDAVQAALRWIKFNQEERQQHLPAICKSFRHPFISSKCLFELESKCLSAECKLVYSSSSTQRVGQVQTELLIIHREMSPSYNSEYVRCYDPSLGVSYKLNMPKNVCVFSMAVTTDDEIYMASSTQYGNWRALKWKNAFFQYNLLLNTWESRCDMIAPRYSCRLVHLKGYIYAIGGKSETETVEMYNPSCDQWTSIAPNPHLIRGPWGYCTVSLDDSIFLISGKGCYCFSTSENTWNKTADLLGPTVNPQAVTYQGCIYSIDCGGSPVYVEMYDPKSSVWKYSGNGKSFDCDSATLMLYKQSLYLLTSRRMRSRGSLVSVYKYSHETDSWLRLERSPMTVFPMIQWLRPGYRTDCLSARMVPTCLENASEDDMQGSSSDEEDDDMSSSDEIWGRITYSYSDNDLGDGNDDGIHDEDREHESDNDDT